MIYNVYEIRHDGSKEHVATLFNKSDANLFCMAKSRVEDYRIELIIEHDEDSKYSKDNTKN